MTAPEDIGWHDDAAAMLGTQAMLWTGLGAGASLTVAIIAALGERRRRRRVDPDRVGIVDWPTIQFAAIVTLLVCLGLILKA